MCRVICCWLNHAFIASRFRTLKQREVHFETIFQSPHSPPTNLCWSKHHVVSVKPLVARSSTSISTCFFSKKSMANPDWTVPINNAFSRYHHIFYPSLNGLILKPINFDQFFPSLNGLILKPINFDQFFPSLNGICLLKVIHQDTQLVAVHRGETAHDHHGFPLAVLLEA